MRLEPEAQRLIGDAEGSGSGLQRQPDAVDLNSQAGLIRRQHEGSPGHFTGFQFGGSDLGRMQRNANASCPLAVRQRLASNGHEAVVSTVVPLLLARSPAAVPGLIVAALGRVSVNRMRARWPRPHVRKEDFERIVPARADRNATSAVVSEVDVRRVAAALSHGQPSHVFRRPIAPDGLAVSCCGSSQNRPTRKAQFVTEAPAASCASVDQVGRCRDGRLAAVAPTQPSPDALLARRMRSHILQRHEAPESLPCKVLRCHLQIMAETNFSSEAKLTALQDYERKRQALEQAGP
jgi:hypothetical protein